MVEILFPLNDAEAYLRGVHPDLQRVIRNELRWSGIGGSVTLKVAPFGKPTLDGYVVNEIVTLEYTSPGIAELPINLISHANKWATVSAFVRDSAGITSLVSKIGVFVSNRQAAELIYAPILCMQANAIDWHAAKMMRGEISGDPELSPFLQTNELPRYNLSDFQAVKSVCDEHGLYATLDHNHLTVEFPWHTGAVSQSFADPNFRQRLLKAGKYSDAELEEMSGATSLLQILLIEHPLYGYGIQSRFQIPTNTLQRPLPEMVNELNQWELSGFDLPPLFGAWCDGDGLVSFVSFIPTQLCVPGLLLSLFHWARLRSLRVRQWLTVGALRN